MHTRRDFIRAAGGVLAGSVAAQTVGAQTDDGGLSFLDRLLGLSAGDELSTVRQVAALADGKVDGTMAKVGSMFDDASPATQLNEIQAFYNAREADWLAYVNGRVSADPQRSVLEITFELDGEEATKYLIAEVDGGRYTKTRIQDTTRRETVVRTVEDGDVYHVQHADGTIETVDSMTYSVDDTLTLRDGAVAMARDDLVEYYREYVSADVSASREYLVRMVGKYGSDAETTLVEASA
ncbi:hypothetical protein C5C07_20285 [Haloferax sp. Atlit-4N]|uniref:hypothetical protein n=1 Tax=Haloferax sp. Atlit-4N TaxID=2077206 RepID=UPI000E23BF8D|nr:hypothetical protein [Haloferax sp. Atlit-4N]RDZ49523.1 hypothetical protein C5C07_20285 [Haloferax sp. Atlit-4N]